MFRKKSSFKVPPRDISSTRTASSSPEAASAALESVPVPPSPAPVVAKKKVEAPKPVGPPSIVPPGTKRVLIVGKYVVMTADVTNCDAVIVEGNLDGKIKAKYVVIMKGGCMRGRVECDEADIAGSFEGVEMITNQRLTLSATARVGGTTTYHRLSVHDGAVLTGELIFKPSRKEEDTAVEPPAPIPVETPEDVGASVAPESGQDDSVITRVGDLTVL